METIKIKSSQNQYIKHTRILHNSKISQIKEQFIIEGTRLFNEALKSGLCLDMIFATEDFLKSAPFEFMEKISQTGKKVFLLSEKLMKHISQVETPPGVLGVAKRNILKKEEFKIEKNELFLVVENIQDPGNLGTILRTALAADMKKIVLSANSVDVYNNKVIRSSAGAVFYQEIYYFNDLLSWLKKIKKEGVNLIATSSQAKQNIINFSFKRPSAIILGSEAHGVSQELFDLADESIFIPLFGSVESFNVAIACGIILYEIMRQTK